MGATSILSETSLLFITHPIPRASIPRRVREKNKQGRKEGKKQVWLVQRENLQLLLTFPLGFFLPCFPGTQVK